MKCLNYPLFHLFLSYDSVNTHIYIYSMITNKSFCPCTHTHTHTYMYIYTYISLELWLYICNYHHHHKVMLAAWSPLTLSCHLSLSFIAPGRSSRLHSVSTHSWHMWVYMVSWHRSVHVVRIYKGTSLTSIEVPNISHSSYLDGLWDGRKVVVQMLINQQKLYM